jgi:SAM-dependent methyltransferase
VRVLDPWRESRTFGLRSHRLLEWLIRATQDTRFGALVTPQTFELEDNASNLASGRRELADGSAFFQKFDGTLTASDFHGLELLDLGCGYGGRTVYYATECGATRVTGLEIRSEMVERCEVLAQTMGIANVDFVLGEAEALPFPDASFDGVIAYDVLEHVRDPEAAFAEVARVLRPRGHAWLVFPTYLGARASHLDYLTRLPALHRLFDLDLLIRVVNRFLTDSRYGTPPQPPPSMGPLGLRTLPTLNGMTLTHSRRLAASAGLFVRVERVVPIVEPNSRVPFGRFLYKSLSNWHRRRELPELLIGSIAFDAIKSDSATSSDASLRVSS